MTSTTRIDPETKRPTRSLFSKPSNSSSWIRNKVDTSFLQSRTFGRPNRPSTPIYGVITGQYQRDWEADQAKAAARRQRKTVRVVADKDVKAQHTLASLGHMKVEGAAPRPRFVMDRFQGVEKKVQTTWDHVPARRGQAASTQLPTSFPAATSTATAKEPLEEQKEQMVTPL